MLDGMDGRSAPIRVLGRVAYVLRAGADERAGLVLLDRVADQPDGASQREEQQRRPGRQPQLPRDRDQPQLERRPLAELLPPASTISRTARTPAPRGNSASAIRSSAAPRGSPSG